jgi:hypothetical protein
MSELTREPDSTVVVKAKKNNLTTNGIFKEQNSCF